MARTKTSTRGDTKTLTTSWRNRHLENIYFCVFQATVIIELKITMFQTLKLIFLFKGCYHCFSVKYMYNVLQHIYPRKIDKIMVTNWGQNRWLDLGAGKMQGEHLTKPLLSVVSGNLTYIDNVWNSHTMLVMKDYQITIEINCVCNGEVFMKLQLHLYTAKSILTCLLLNNTT